MSRLSAWRRWQDAAGPWRGWAICPALTMPGGSPPAAITVPPSPDLRNIFTGGGTAVLLDLEPTLGVAMAAEANHRGLAHAVLVLPRWPHGDAVLPTAELLGVLEATAARVEPTHASNVIFVLDAERQRSVERPAVDARVDNRYALAVGDLPDLAALRAAGIQRIVRVVHSR